MSKQNQPISASSAGPRPTIGVLVDSMELGYQIDLWQNIKKAAEKHDANLLCFIGREIDSPISYNVQANVIYELVHPGQNIDGLIVLTGTMAHFVDQERLTAFLQNYQAVQVVSIAFQVAGFPSILLDNYAGTSAAIEHLIKDHGHTEIAFVRMREGHQEGDQRFKAYQDTLARYGIAYDPELVVPGDYYDQAAEIVKLLYDERQRRPQAISVVGDYMAIPLQQELRSRGIQIPEDVAVIGFDDIENARYQDPPLTTLRQPLMAQAEQAVQIILDALKNKPVPEEVILPPELVLRASCGCSPISIQQAALPLEHVDSQSENQPGKLRTSLIEAIISSTAIDSHASAEALVDAFLQDIEQAETGKFLAVLASLFRQTHEDEKEILEWQAPLAILREQIFKTTLHKANRLQAENLIQQARVLLTEDVYRYQANRRLESQAREADYRALTRILNTVTDSSQLTVALADNLPTLGITATQVVLYEDQTYPCDHFQILLSFDGEQPADLPEGGLDYPADDFLPSGSLPTERRFTKIVEPLSFQESQFGFIVFEASAPDETIYGALAEQISSALKGISLVEQVEHRALQLLTAAEVSQTTTDILEPETLLQKTVDLVQERFELYYSGIFIKDEDGRYAVLQAGTGEPGQKMIAAGWRLEIGGGSMIGRCVSDGKADIQLDVFKAPIHLRNPHLPETRSEMALPLISRGEVLGALTIQSTQANAFTPDDATILQTMANQIATALTNANLFEQTQATIRELESIQRRYEIQAWSEYTRTQEVSGYIKTEEGFTPLSFEQVPGVKQALQEAKPVRFTDETETTLAIPIFLRDQPIGVLGIKSNKERAFWSDDEVNLAQTIAEQFAIAAESLRLLDETQRRAARERLVAEITTKLRATNDPQTMLQMAVVELRQALNAQRAQVLIQPPSLDTDSPADE